MSQGFDPDLIRQAAMRDGLQAFVPDGTPEIPTNDEADQVVWTAPPGVALEADRADSEHRFHDGTPMFPPMPRDRALSRLSAELEEMIDAAVEAYRVSLVTQVRSAIEAQVLRMRQEAEAHPATVTGPGTDVDPRARVTRVGFGKENLEETFTWPGTCCTSDGRSDGSEIVCGHEIRWFFGASVHASGEPRTGFACEVCWTGACDHLKAPTRSEATFPIHE